MPKRSSITKKEGLEINIPARQHKRKPGQNHANYANHASHRKVVPYVQTNVPEDRAFLTLNGRHIRNLVELAAMLEQMDDHVFHYHAGERKNDFSNWIRDVMGYEQLADAIHNKDRVHAQVEVLKFVVKRLIE